MVDTIIQFYSDYLLYAIAGTVITIFIIIRLYKTARIYLGIKSYVKKSKKLRKKNCSLSFKIVQLKVTNWSFYAKLDF